MHRCHHRHVLVLHHASDKHRDEAYRCHEQKILAHTYCWIVLRIIGRRFVLTHRLDDEQHDDIRRIDDTVGWDDESYTKFGWDEKTIDAYKELHKRFKEHGVIVHIIDSKSGVDDIIKTIKMKRGKKHE